MRWKVTLSLSVFFIGYAVGLGQSQAGDAGLQAMADAYAPYRMSLSYLRAGETDLAQVLLQQFIDKWTKLTSAWSAAPPQLLAGDTKLKPSLAGILAAAKAASAAVDAGDAAKATSLLEPIRGEVAAIRHRSGVRTLSDCIDDISAQMDALWKLRESNFDSHDPTQAQNALSIVRTLEPILDRCKGQSLADNPAQFQRLLDQASHSLGDAKQSITEQDTDRFIRIVRELHSIDNILFQQFD